MVVCVAACFASCKSSQSAYKKAYEKAKQQELAESQISEPTDAEPVESVEPVKTATAASSPLDRHEKVEVVGDGTLLKYSVVCGSFGLKTNAEGLKNRMVDDGYNALVVFNPEIAMYRVIVATFADRASAADARDRFKERYPSNKDFQAAWLLVKAN